MRPALSLILAICADPVLADDPVRITDRAAFVDLVGGKRLTSLGVSMTVDPSGTIGGRAFGRDVTGDWTWDDGYFCRTMQAGDRSFARNCQVVQQRGNRLRFIADRGQGDTADLAIR
jgi:hypothetical protein